MLAYGICDIVFCGRKDRFAKCFAKSKRSAGPFPSIGDHGAVARRDGSVERLQNAELGLLEFSIVELFGADFFQSLLKNGKSARNIRIAVGIKMKIATAWRIGGSA